MRRVHAIVTGDVQGVGYRYTMRLAARHAGVAGWVRNRRDGSVEAEIEGTDRQVDRLLAWMAKGPPGALPTVARVEELPPTGATGFEVHPTV
ncbi:MAG TPA: acylphosphatase [Microbacterium sp.]|uniref:acylphosphatase n=1 Tax=Microbacterium sp. TaxID=51671 RepID=UPI002B48368B|nr:acylphosphatase [Microbacterium sp.]HKT57216.1 acylphosphatase [Microbacterium sp.]